MLAVSDQGEARTFIDAPPDDPDDDKTQKQRENAKKTMVVGISRAVLTLAVIALFSVVLFQWAVHPDNNERGSVLAEMEIGRSPGAAYQRSLALAKCEFEL